MHYPQVEENGLIRLAVAEFEQILKPLFEQTVNQFDMRSYLVTEHPPQMGYADEWFGQGVYRRRGWNFRFAVVELCDHFLIIPEGQVTKIWHQEKFGMKRLAPWHAPNMTFAGHDLLDGLKKLAAKYA